MKIKSTGYVMELNEDEMYTLLWALRDSLEARADRSQTTDWARFAQDSAEYWKALQQTGSALGRADLITTIRSDVRDRLEKK